MPGRDSSMIKCSQEQEGAFKDEGMTNCRGG